MVFEEKIKEHEFTPVVKIAQVRVDLEPKRENELQKINEVYSKEVFLTDKKIGRNKLIKIAIDNLINDLEALSEEEAIEYIKKIYKEAEF